jgi:2-oxoglutarate dehydrogenase E2 component (dihydrolipoamide succinyltransferase)
MAKEIKIILPSMGEGITDARITRWLVKVGDKVEMDQPIVEIATDKVDSEVPSSSAGTVKELLYKEGDSPLIGQPIMIITAEGEVMIDDVKVETKSIQESSIKPDLKQPMVPSTPSQPSQDDSFIGLSPLVRKIVKEEGITTSELNQIKGSGLNGRINKDDILAYVQKRDNKINEIEVKAVETVQNNTSTQSTETGARHEVIPMDRMRKLIAEHMVMSKQTSAHVTSFIEVDVTNMVEWRNRNKDSFQKSEGEKLTLTHLFAEATIQAIKKHPLINSSVDGDKIILKRDINLSIATALPNGNLIVPVVKNSDRLNLTGLAKNINDIATRARENKLKPDEIQGGTFTVTNLGMFDTLTGTPIINQPQVAILAIGSIKKRPVVIETSSGDVIGIRQMCILSLSYDHRIVDGALAGNFLKSLKDTIEDFKLERTF